jgi:hypothetical protein
MPGYGIAAESDGSGLLDWSWARIRLEGSPDYWVATVGPGNRPHVMPVWGVLLDERLMWSTSPTSRKARNLAENPAITVTTSDATHPVVLEGIASLVVDPALIGKFASAMDCKYSTDQGVDFYAANATFSVRPIRVFGLDTDDFTGSPTRWTFPPAD